MESGTSQDISEEASEAQLQIPFSAKKKYGANEAKQMPHRNFLRHQKRRKTRIASIYADSETPIPLSERTRTSIAEKRVADSNDMDVKIPMICVTTVPDLEPAEAPVTSPPGDSKLLGAELCRCKNRKLRLLRQPRIWQPRIRHLEAIEPPAPSSPTKPVTNEPIVSTNIGQLTESTATLYAMAPCLVFGTG